MKTAIYNPVKTERALRTIRTLARACATLFLLAGVTAQAATPAGNAITSVESSSMPGGKVMVRVNLKEALANTPAGFTVANPARIALDLPDTGNAVGRNTIEANLGPLVSVNVVQAGTRTRLVLNLSKPVEYETKLDGKSLIVSLSETGGVASAPSNVSPRFSEAATNGARHSIKDIDFRRGPNGEARIVTTLSDAQAGINIRQQAKGVVVDFINTEIPRALQRRLDVMDFATPVQQVDAYALGDNSRMFVESKGAWEYSAYQTDNQFIVEVRTSTDETKKTSDGKPVYTGEKLSLNFQNVEVRSVLQVIADFTGLNIIASDTVGGNLTLRLKDVPWDQALDLILTTKGLDKRKNGNVVWIAPKDELLNKEKAELEAKASVRELEPLVTEYIPLNYLRADEAQAMLNGANVSAVSGTGKASCAVASEGLGATTSATLAAAQTGKDEEKKILSKRGRATYDGKTNMLIVNDTAKKIDEVRELLAKIDVPARQVLIEARVVIADDTFGRQLGARLGIRTNNLGVNSSNQQTGIGFGSGLNDSLALASGSPTGTTLPNVSLPVTNTTGGVTPASIGMTLLNIATGNLISLELTAMEADNRGKVISNPRVVTTNQKPAVILQGVQIPYTTTAQNSGGSTATNTTQFVDAFLCLLVDPQILNNDSVILNVEIQKDSPGQAVAGGSPPIQRRRVKTQVRVNNGETAVLGGIYEQVSRNDVNKVPFLGDLPFLGNLFKNSDRNDTKIELMIFLTPRILDERLTLR
jgi:type IV pilus assembly protein PilQ